MGEVFPFEASANSSKVVPDEDLSDRLFMRWISVRTVVECFLAKGKKTLESLGTRILEIHALEEIRNVRN